MTENARHADDRSHFARDLVIWIVGVAFFGALTFGLLALFADPTPSANPGDGSTSTSAPTTTPPDDSTTTTDPDGSTTTTDPGSTTVPVRPPNEVTVHVLNFPGGIRGAAAALTQTLSQEGYQILPASDLRQDNDRSRIWYREGFAAEAAALLGHVPGALVEALPDNSISPAANIIIFLGPDFEE